MAPTQFAIGSYIEIADDLGTPQDGTLFQVIEQGRKYHTVQQVNSVYGGLCGVPVGWLTGADLIVARAETLADYGDVLTVVIERIETTSYSTTYTRNEVVELLTDNEHQEAAAQPFETMSLPELTAALAATLNEADDVADTVIAKQGCSDSAYDEWAVMVPAMAR